MATLLSAFSVTAFATDDDDDNAMSGAGDMNHAAQGYAWYNGKQYLWKVTLFVGKSDQATKQDNLQQDFHRIGTVIMKKTGWTVPEGTKFGNATKVDYYSGTAMTMDTSPYIISDSRCPSVPFASGGKIETVKAYFGSTGTMSTILNGIADDRGMTKQAILSSLTFTIGGRTMSGWDFAYLNPNATTNRVPWVIVYEPMVVLNLKDNTTKLAFTATELALCELNGWYDWNRSGGTGQNCASLSERYLPTSVQLEESWFGYPVYAITDGNFRWKHEDVVKGGGWGMRWMDPAVVEPQVSWSDYGCSFTSVNTAPTVGSYGNVTVSWTNYEADSGPVMCCLYRGDTLLWSGLKTIPAGTTIQSSYSVYYDSTERQTLACTINWQYHSDEADSGDNYDVVNVTPVRSVVSMDTDYGVCFLDVEQPCQDTYGNVKIWWKNWTGREGEAQCELYVDGNRIWSENKYFGAYESIESAFQIYYSGTQTHTLMARINYAYRSGETDATDNLDTEVVTPTQTSDDTYDLSVLLLTVTPDTAYQGGACTVSFISDNWNRDRAYSNILVEVLVDGNVAVSKTMDYKPFGRYQHSYTLYLEDPGSHTITARINWDNRNLEDNRDNNMAVTTVTVKPYYEFSVSNLQVERSTCYEGDTIKVTFRTDSWDQYNAYEDISVELLIDGKVITTQHLDYSAYAGRNHSWYVTFVNNPGVYTLSARINWSDRASEADPDNNSSEAVEIVIKEKKDLTIEAVAPNSDYRAGMTVVTSFVMHNVSWHDVLPEHGNKVTFEAYYFEEDVKIPISQQAWEQAVIPAKDSNLVYFKWTIPNNLAGKRIYCKATVNADLTIEEYSTENNSDTLDCAVTNRLSSQTPDTRFEKEKPNGYTIPAVPATKAGKATWSLWVYENGAFVKKNYGLAISSTAPLITPDADSPSAEYVDGYWKMRSGYGFTISYKPAVTVISGYEAPGSNAFTIVQQAYVVFPEFNYSTAQSYFRTLQKADSQWVFVQNTNADENDRMHFTPLWFPNGDYIVSATATDVWTPAGMISTTRNSNKIIIVDSAYDDWYVGEL